MGFTHVSTATQTPPGQQLLSKHTGVPVPTQSPSLSHAGAPSHASSAKHSVDPGVTAPPQKQVSLDPQFWKVPQTPGLVQEVDGLGDMVVVTVEVRVEGGRVVVVAVMLKQEQAEA